MLTTLLSVSSPVLSVQRSVEKLPGGTSTFQLLPQQLRLLLGALHESSVLLGSARQAGQHLTHRPVGGVLTDREACRT